MNNKCIGIISYIPDDNRETRLRKINNLLNRCDELFNLPILLVAQNWTKEDLRILDNHNVVLFNYKNKLGIVGARKALRNYFLKTDYDYLIMLDDDINLKGLKRDGERYLSQIDKNANKVGLFLNLTLQLFCIPKSIYSQINFPDGEPENEDFFEDLWLISVITKLYKDKVYRFDRYSLYPEGNASCDPDSTWYHGQISKHKMASKTREMVNEYTN